EMPDDDKSISKTKAAVEAALAGESATLWLTDKRGKETAIPSAKSLSLSLVRRTVTARWALAVS
ncbi:MAG: hypothetical protein ACKOGL_01910, partial [Acidimicrobiaceae bacterium]